MSKRLTGVLGATLIIFSLAVLSVGQTPQTTTTTTPTKIQAIQNSDGTYTIVEYPVGKETTVTLTPVGLNGATGTATILRAADATNVTLKLASLPAEVTAMSLYAIDPNGKVTLLGPVQIASGAGTFTTSTPLTKFMLVASPDDALTAYNDSTTIFFRSAVPAGLTVIPITNAVGETVAAVAVPATPAVVMPATPAVVTPATPAVVTPATPAVVTPATPVVEPATPAVVATTDATMPTTAVIPTDYTVSMLGIPTFKKGDDTKLKVNFTGAMEGARANIFIEPHKKGKITEVLMRFHDLKEAPKGTAYILWAITPDGQFTQLGQIVNVKGRNEAEIKSEVPFDDFGLLLTTEDLGGTKGTIVKPSGQRVGVIQLVP